MILFTGLTAILISINSLSAEHPQSRQSSMVYDSTNPRILISYLNQPLFAEEHGGQFKRSYQTITNNFDPDSVIKSDFILNDDTRGGCSQGTPKIASNTVGNFVICWYEFRDGDADIWYQLYDSSGVALGCNQRVNTDITMNWQGDPAVAGSLNGNFIFTWEDRRQLGNSDIFAQRFDRNGNRLGDNFRINDSTAAGDQSISAVSVVPNGISLIVWDDRRNGITGDIYGRFLNPDGSLRGNDFRINDDPLNYGNQYEPDIGSDDSNRFVVVWMDGRDGNWNIYGQRLNCNGMCIDSNFRVTAQESIQWSPRVAVGPAGNFVVTWNDRRRNQWDVYAQIYDTSGTPVDTNFRINCDAGDADQLLGDVAINRYGEFIVVWSDKRNGNDDIYAQIFNSSGIRIGSEFKINDDISSSSQISPTVIALSDGGYYVAWADARNGNFDIYCQRITRSGSKIRNNFRVNDDSNSSHQRVSSVGQERFNRRTLIAWEDERSGNCDIYATVINRFGTPVSQNFRVNDDPSGANSHFYPSSAGGNKRFIVCWHDSRQGGDIYAQMFSDDGGKIGGNFLVNEGNISASQWYPYCAMDTYNRAVIVWMDYRQTQTFPKIYARLYDENGNPAGPEFCVGETPESIPEAFASVAMNSAGYWVVSWMDYRNGNSDIYCQLFTPRGEKIGPNKRVNLDGQNVLQSYPACAIDDNRNIAIAWEDKRNGSYDIYLQLLDSLGNLIGGNERVNDNPPGHSDCYSPSCAFDETGRLAVMFNGEFENIGNPQIFCQRFRSDGTRIGHNQKINEPNLFPNNSHWTVGQSVIANSEFIVFTWTDNRRHQGWDISCKITDWNLIGIHELTYQDPKYQSERFPNIGTFLLRQRNKISFSLRHATTICIYSICGSLMYKINVTGKINSISVDNLAPGIYFFNIQDNHNHNFIYKVVIM